jgi:hypothetical protein
MGARFDTTGSVTASDIGRFLLTGVTLTESRGAIFLPLSASCQAALSVAELGKRGRHSLQETQPRPDD